MGRKADMGRSGLIPSFGDLLYLSLSVFTSLNHVILDRLVVMNPTRSFTHLTFSHTFSLRLLACGVS